MVVGRPESADGLAALCERHGAGEPLTLGADGGGTLTEAARTMPDRFETVARAAGDLAALLYTSGTTGRPKGAMLTHANLSSNAQVLHAAWGFREGDVLLHMLPIFHTHGLFVACHTSLLNGSPMLFCPRFDPAEARRLLPRATVFMGVPTFYARLLALPGFGRGDCAGIRLFVSGSAPLLEQTFEEFRERTGHVILERYGMTECGMSTSNPLRGERRAGTVGLPLPGVDLRVAGGGGAPAGPGEVGEIEFRGPNVFSGYWRLPEKTAEEFTADGYFRSGDLGWIDEDGYVAITGRGKDLVITGGLNVYPKEVELLIDKLDGGGGIRGDRAAPSRLRGAGHRGGGAWGGCGGAGRAVGGRCAEERSRGLQGPETGVLRGGPAAQRHGQGAEERAEGAVRSAAGRRTGSRATRPRNRCSP